MKKILFTIIIILTTLITSGCSMVLQGQQYGYEEQYNEDYAYLDDYAQVNWNDAKYDMQYTYYDTDKMFLVVYGNRIFVIPYEYFYRYIRPYFRMRIIWRSYDYFCTLWGWGYYNNLWNHWYHHHRRPYWRPRFNYYNHHKRQNNNRPIIIKKNSIQKNGYSRSFKPRTKITANKIIKSGAKRRLDKRKK